MLKVTAGGIKLKNTWVLIDVSDINPFLLVFGFAKFCLSVHVSSFHV